MSSDRRVDRTDSRDDPPQYTYEEATDLDPGAFEGGPVDRRTFLRVAAATGAVLTLPGAGVGAGATAAQVDDDALTDLAAFVVDATPDDYEATLVLEFSDTDALDAFYDEYGEPDWDVDEDVAPPKAVVREEPTPAAHAYLTADELADVLSAGGVEFVDFSPGSNPFWKLEAPYADRVFPPAEEARDFVSHEETAQALSYLEDEYPDRVRVHAIGEGPGWGNVYTGEDPDPQEIYVAEVTDDVRDDESFREKEKAVFVVSIHGNEPAGRETATRIIEGAARGEADDFEDLLDEIAIVWVFVNPDGWVRRDPRYVAPDVLSFTRGNSAGVDTNRQYPTMGWINPVYNPADPTDAPDEYWEVVPDALATVGHLRGYDNVTYLCDYHMMDVSSSMVLNLETNAPFDHDGTHDLDEVNVRIGDGMVDHWGGTEAIADDTERAASVQHGIEGYVPERLLDYGSIYDSLGYQITGGLLGWAGQPEEFGGLGAVTVAPELVLRDDSEYKPFIERHLATAYRISMREFAEMTAAETDATIATGGKDVAYVTTDALTRTSADLSHTDESPGEGDGNGQERATRVRRSHETVQPGPNGAASAPSTDATRALAAAFDARGADEGIVSLRDPDGRVVRGVDLADPASGHDRGRGSFYVPDPAAGEWSVAADAAVDVEFVAIEADEEHPDPEEVLGYAQREYVVNPMQFFADLEPELEDGSLTGLRVHDVRIGRLMRGATGERRYDSLVISSDVAADDAAYVTAVEEFVAAGGDLVLTDAGVSLLAELDVGDAADITADDVERIELDIANLVDRAFDDPLLAGIRSLQREIWKGSQLGYTTGFDSPATIVDDDAFAAAGGDVAGRMQRDESNWWEPPNVTAEGVAAGTLSAGDAEITLLGSVLPVANQRELHPFGMADYAVSFMGHTLVCNALGFEQRRYVDGELVGTWGEIR